MTGFETQNTILGTYTYNGKEKIVCACEDFLSGNTDRHNGNWGLLINARYQ